MMEKNLKEHAQFVQTLSEKAAYFDKIKCMVLNEDITRSSYGISFYVESLIKKVKQLERLLSEESISIEFGDYSIDKEGPNKWVIYNYEDIGSAARKETFENALDAYAAIVDYKK